LKRREPLIPVAAYKTLGVRRTEHIPDRPPAVVDDEGQLGLEVHVGTGKNVREQIVVRVLPGRVATGVAGTNTDFVDGVEVAGLVRADYGTESCRHRPSLAGRRRLERVWLASWAAMVADLPELLVHDEAAWRRWLEDNHAGSPGVWVVLAKKGTTQPTSLTYDQALAEAACFGWIDGQLGRRDEATYRQRFTPRRPRSAWSANNVALAGRLIADGRMRPSGLLAVERAKTDGRWEAAYAGSASIEVPADLAEALAADAGAQTAFERLNRLNRYAVLYRVSTAATPKARARRVDRFVAMLSRGEAIYPQKGFALNSEKVKSKK
jgi:uncharacterized protein YdeI (YjbR/CyaY-like superfamily)